MSEVKDKKSQEQLENLTATPEILKGNGREYRLMPMGLSSIAGLRRWVRSQLKEELKETLKLLEGAPEDLVKKTWDEYYQDLKNPMISSVMETPEAVQYWVYLCINQGDTTVTQEEVKGLVQTYSIKTLLGMLTKLNGLKEEDLNDPRLTQALRNRRPG